MPRKKIYAFPNGCTPGNPVTFDPQICNGCNQCVDVCQVDVLIPNPEKGKPPIVLFPEECWYAGCCEGVCPRPGAIQIHLPLPQRVRWKQKQTGGHFRVSR